MENLKIEQKLEAIKRMKKLDIYTQAIKEFEKDNMLNKSESGGILFWLDENEQEMVKEFEEKYNATVYHLIHNYTEYGELYSFLFVSQYKDDWDYDDEDLNNNRSLVYVKNIDEDAFSEFGTIGIRSQFGGLIRTC